MRCEWDLMFSDVRLANCGQYATMNIEMPFYSDFGLYSRKKNDHCFSHLNKNRACGTVYEFSVSAKLLTCLKWTFWNFSWLTFYLA